MVGKGPQYQARSHHHIYAIRGSHFDQSEEPEVGGIRPEVGGHPLRILFVFDR